MAIAVLVNCPGHALAGDTTGSDSSEAQGTLAEAAQNPIAAMISLPLQNNTFFRTGPDNDTVNVLNIQPVIPFSLGEDWNVITRTIVPLIYMPTLTNSLPETPNAAGRGDDFGLGDINMSAFLSPASKGIFTWGIGPSLAMRTATSGRLGTQKWSAGPTVVALVTAKPWVAGTLVRQLWSFAGDNNREDVNQTLVQPFINYNLPDGWYLVTAPIITVNWQASRGNAAFVPVGGGVGRVFAVGGQAINTQVQGFYNAVRPDYAPQSSLRLQLTFLFPK
ncbi:hypothetical protein [Defluviicoccus vanus]|uniref:hypothetical protein n=1 Tax=Defluviicoccus vanus TaxID=111831 RepID=UPI001CBA66CD|nr:hypothetical protein [Defluviicoccus vanus]